MVYPPRDGDLTREAILAMAQNVTAKGMDVWFKFTCPSCGFRCTTDTKNTLLESYECCNCQETHTPEFFGLLVAVVLNPLPNHASPSSNGDAV